MNHRLTLFAAVCVATLISAGDFQSNVSPREAHASPFHLTRVESDLNHAEGPASNGQAARTETTVVQRTPFDGRLTIISSVNAKGNLTVNDEILFQVTDGASIVGKPFVIENKGEFTLYQEITPIDASKPYYMVYRLDKVTYDPEHWEYVYTDTLKNASQTVGIWGPLDARGFFGRPDLIIMDPREETASPEVLNNALYDITGSCTENVQYTVHINDKEINVYEGGYITQSLRNHLKPGKNLLKVVMTPKQPGEEYEVKITINRSLMFEPGDKTDHPYIAVLYREKEPQTKVLSFYVDHFNPDAAQ